MKLEVKSNADCMPNMYFAFMGSGICENFKKVSDLQNSIEGTSVKWG